MKTLMIEIHDEHWLTLQRLAQAHDVSPESHASALVSAAMTFPSGPQLDSPMMIMALLGSTRDPFSVVKTAKRVAAEQMGVCEYCGRHLAMNDHAPTCPKFTAGN